MKIQQTYYSACGKRERNEDCAWVEMTDAGLAAAVADGVGGSDRGEDASAAAIEALQLTLRGCEISEEAVEKAILRAHEAVRSVNRDDSSARTTVAAVCIGASAFAVNIGDTRIYQFREGRICYQSVDHSVAQMAVFAREIAPGEIRSHPGRNLLTRALGSERTPSMDLTELDVCCGDRFLICSDGFWEHIPEERMERLCREYDEAALWLKAMRSEVERVESDNHTAIVLQVDQR